MQGTWLATTWHAAGHGVDWLDRASEIAAWTGFAVLALLIVRALLRRRSYQAVDVLTGSETASLRAQIAQAEAKTVGEINVVVLERSDGHPQAEWLVSVATMLVGAVLAGTYLESTHASLWLLIHSACGAAGFCLARALPDLKRTFVSSSRALEMVEEQALQEFARLGVHGTTARSGVLILVSIFERAAVVLADDGIHTKTGQDAWQGAVHAMVSQVKKGRLESALRSGIDAVAAVLVRHHPRASEGPNELPNHLIVRRE